MNKIPVKITWVDKSSTLIDVKTKKSEKQFLDDISTAWANGPTVMLIGFIAGDDGIPLLTKIFVPFKQVKHIEVIC